MNKYYIVIDDEKKGAFSIEELQNINFDKDTLVWFKGQTVWIRAEEVEELKELLKNVPPPIPSNKSISTQKIKIESPVEINLVKKSKFSKEKIAEKQRKITKGFLTEIGYLLLYFVISILVAFMTYQIYFASNKPVFVSDENQESFNDELSKRSNDSEYGQFAFGDIMYKYLGSYKFDEEIYSLTSFEDINNTRILILKSKTKEIAMTLFYILFAGLIVIRYLRIFINWLGIKNKDVLPIVKEDDI